MTVIWLRNLSKRKPAKIFHDILQSAHHLNDSVNMDLT